MDATRPSADRCNDLGPGGLFARTDRRAARTHPQGRDGGLCALGQVPPSARNGDGRRAVTARNADRNTGSRTTRRLMWLHLGSPVSPSLAGSFHLKHRETRLNAQPVWPLNEPAILVPIWLASSAAAFS